MKSSDETSALLINDHDKMGLHHEQNTPHESYSHRLLSVPIQMLPVSIFSFGGPQAHLGLAHERFVGPFL